MHQDLRPEQIEILVGSPAVNDEFSKKIRELDRRLQANGMSYRDWEILNDRQHDVFSHDMFLDGECANSVRHYVMGAVDSCWCPDVVEDLHHHSPVLIREIEKQQDMLPDMTVKIGESLNNLNETIDLLLENIILSEQVKCGNPDEGVKFELALVYEARRIGGGDLNSEDARCGKEFSSYPAGADQKRKSAKGKDFITHGQQALRAIALLKDAGVTDDELATARSASKGMFNMPQDKGEPKTDVIIGEGENRKLISLKMEGSIQLASKELRGATDAFQKALEQFTIDQEEKVKSITEQAKAQAITSSVQSLSDQLGSLVSDMMSAAYDDGKARRFVSGDYDKTLKLALGSARRELTKKGVDKDVSPQEFEKLVLQKAKSAVDPKFDLASFSGAKAGLGAPREATAIIAKVKDEYDWDKFTSEFKKDFVARLGALLQSDDDFYFMYIDEELTGRRSLAEYPGAAAEWILSPTSFKSLSPDSADYEENVRLYMAVDADVRGKGRGYGRKSPTIRLSIDPDLVKAKAMETVETVTQQAENSAPANRADELSESEISKDVAGKFVEIINSEEAKDKLEKDLSDAINVDDIVAQLGQESEDN
jgi:hypothetical protein